MGASIGRDRGGVVAYRDPADQRAAERRWYRANRQRVFDKKNAKKARLRALLRTLKEQPCADCGITYPYYVMDFDHVDGDKEMTVSSIVNRGGTARLLAEVAKCEVVCANCHRIRTWSRMNRGERVAGQRSPTVTDAGRQLSLFGDRAGVDDGPG